MPDFTPGKANRAAAGIRPVVRIPGKEGSDRTRRAQLFAKPAPEVLRILSEVHRRRSSTGGGRPPPAPFGRPLPTGPIRAQPGRGAGPILSDRTRQQPIRIGADRFDPERLMTACIGGQFLVENAAGRTRIAKAIVAQVRATGRRDGMDGLLLTALLHLQSVKDPAAGEALDVWRKTVGTAGGGAEPAFDSGTGQIGTVGPGTLADPFADGLARPNFMNELERLHGGHVASWAGWVSAGCTILGAVIGGVIGASAGVVGAGAGAVGGAKEGHDFGETLIGWIKEWFGGDEKGDTDKGETPDAPKDQGGDVAPPAPPPPPPKDEGGGGDGGDDGGDDDPPKETGWPPDNPGYPPPDGDGGGNPWDRVGFGPLVAVTRAQALAKANASGIASIAAIPAFAAIQQAMPAQSPIFAQIGRRAVDLQQAAGKLQVAVKAVEAVAVNAGRIGPAAVK